MRPWKDDFCWKSKIVFVEYPETAYSQLLTNMMLIEVDFGPYQFSTYPDLILSFFARIYQFLHISSAVNSMFGIGYQHS